MPYTCIVVGTDGSETATRAVQAGAELAAETSARLVVVTAFEDDGTSGDDAIPSDVRWMINGRNEADRIARAGREAATAVGASDVVVQAVAGDPADQVLDAAETFGADLIVVGSVGLASAARFVLGSVASTVSHHAPCDVLVVHTDD